MSTRKINFISDLKPGDHITWLEVDQRPGKDLELMGVPSVPHWAIVLSTSPYLTVIHKRRSGVCTGALEMGPKQLKKVDYPPDECFPPDFTIAFAQHLETEDFPSDPSTEYDTFPIIGGSLPPFTGSHNEPVVCPDPRTPDCDWMHYCPCKSFAEVVKSEHSYALEDYVAKLRAENAVIPDYVEKVLSCDDDGECVQ